MWTMFRSTLTNQCRNIPAHHSRRWRNSFPTVGGTSVETVQSTWRIVIRSARATRPVFDGADARAASRDRHHRPWKPIVDARVGVQPKGIRRRPDARERLAHERAGIRIGQAEASHAPSTAFELVGELLHQRRRHLQRDDDVPAIALEAATILRAEVARV